MYEDWEEKDYLAYHRFVPADRLYAILTILMDVKFSVKAERDAAREQLDALVATTVVGEESRFPKLRYVDVTSGRCADILVAIRAALDLGERHIRTDDSEFQRRLDDHKVSFTKNVSRLLALLRARGIAAAPNGIFDRTSFEMWYELKCRYGAETQIKIE